MIEKILAIILEEVNGYSHEEAIKLAPDNEGSELWVKLEALNIPIVSGSYCMYCEKELKPNEGITLCKKCTE